MVTLTKSNKTSSTQSNSPTSTAEAALASPPKSVRPQASKQLSTPTKPTSPTYAAVTTPNGSFKIPPLTNSVRPSTRAPKRKESNPRKPGTIRYQIRRAVITTPPRPFEGSALIDRGANACILGRDVSIIHSNDNRNCDVQGLILDNDHEGGLRNVPVGMAAAVTQSNVGPIVLVIFTKCRRR